MSRIQGYIRHMVDVERFAGGEARELIKDFDKRMDELIDKAAREYSKRGITLSVMVKRISPLAKEMYDGLIDQLRTVLDDFAVSEIEFNNTALERAAASAGLAINAAKASASNAVKRALALPPGDSLLATLGHYLRQWGARQKDVFISQIRRSFARGEPVEVIVRRLRGTPGLRHRDGLAGANRRQLRGLVHTAVNQVANQARAETYEANDDLVDRIMWVSTLDSRTTPICQVRDGQIWKLEDALYPPAHFRCRSSTVPLLVGETKEDILGTRPSVSQGKAKSVPATTTYETWLRGQPRDVIDDVLGPTRSRLFRQGNLSLRKFMNNGETLLTLDELKKRNRKIWNEVLGDAA